jgi:hypothetical protein
LFLNKPQLSSTKPIAKMMPSTAKPSATFFVNQHLCTTAKTPGGGAEVVADEEDGGELW